ncbi:Hypothetical protein, putative [Bodo saltans]|uniref:Uncharacterized protein n=1 Tax=Bodo saltans TaxID=75058 RepID=A0A0S4IWZ1_BODSA|nr:Hypothetical protein, putative [Bodo saltans]|eukprot:CUF83838.1 Hypothetical protein, putative [Bodo saltans]
MSGIEHGRWLGSNSPNHRGSFRKTKYRSLDPLSKRPMARASFFFSPEAISPDGLLAGLPGLQRKCSQRESPLLQRSASSIKRSGSTVKGFSNQSLADPSSGNYSFQFGSPAPTSPAQQARQGSSTIGRSAVTFAGASSTTSSFGGRPPQGGISDQVVSSAAEQPLPLVDYGGRIGSPPLAPSSAAAMHNNHMATMQDIVRLCPTPTAGTQITSSVVDLKDFGRATSTHASFQLPSLIFFFFLKGKTTIARLINANRALVGFEEEPIEDPHRATSSLM